MKCANCGKEILDLSYSNIYCTECMDLFNHNDATNIQLDESKATKHDEGKLPLDLLPVESIEEIAKVLQFGQRKYDSWNWSKGFKWSRLLGACLRHLFAYMRGEDKDPESGLSHLAHCGCCILFLLYHEKYYKSLDDRHIRPEVK